MISKANFELLLREGRSFEEYFRFEEEEPDPEDLLPPDDQQEAADEDTQTEETEESEDVGENGDIEGEYNTNDTEPSPAEPAANTEES